MNYKWGLDYALVDILAKINVLINSCMHAADELCHEKEKGKTNDFLFSKPHACKFRPSCIEFELNGPEN